MEKYFICILPPAGLSDEITSLRKKYLPGVNKKDERKKFPHLTLQHTFSRSREIETPLSDLLETLASRISPFEIKLNGFGHFDKEVIYLQVENNDPLQSLFEKVKHLLLFELNFGEHEVPKKFTPHITLEKKLNKTDFKLGWEHIKDVIFKEPWLVDSISLMKHDGRKWQELKSYPPGRIRTRRVDF